MIPKDEGYSIMVSALQSRELGFRMNLSDDDLKTVNQWQKDRPDYTDTESAIKLNGTTEKEELKESPFFIYFEKSAEEGYWMFNHVALQFESCADCFRALFPEYDSIWIFDHSCGHDCGREDGLIVSNMNTNWGASKTKYGHL